MSLHRLYGAFSKVTAKDDGSLLVEGIASTETVDSQGEIVKASAMAAALPGYMKFGNVREMHQAIAAGKAVACAVDDSGVTHLTAHVVDANSVAKVKAGVLLGFSIGGVVKSRDKANAKIIDGLDLTEISLVDRPANPDATFQLCKIEKPAEDVSGTVSISSATTTGSVPVVVPAAKAALSENLRKSLYSVGWLAETLSTLDCLASDAKWEEMYEGDSSTIPARLKAAVAELAAILRDMAAEETAELTGDQIAAAAKPGTLVKTEKLAALLKALSAPRLPAEEIEKFTAYWNGLLTKAAPAKAVEAAPDAVLTKRATDAEAALGSALEKVAAAEKTAAEATDAASQAGEALQKVMAEHADLTSKLATATADLARKGVLRVVPITKNADGAAAAATVEEPQEPEPTDPVSAIRKVHAGGGFNPFRPQ